MLTGYGWWTDWWIEFLLWTLCFRHGAFTNDLLSSGQPPREVLSPPLYRWRDWSPRSLSHLPKFTYPIFVRTEIKTQVSAESPYNVQLHLLWQRTIWSLKLIASLISDKEKIVFMGCVANICLSLRQIVELEISFWCSKISMKPVKQAFKCVHKLHAYQCTLLHGALIQNTELFSGETQDKNKQTKRSCVQTTLCACDRAIWYGKHIIMYSVVIIIYQFCYLCIW